MSVQIVPLSAISIGEDRQRKLFSEEEMAELRASILTEKGLINPILVRPDNEEEGKYWLVAGERRFRSISTITQSYAFGNNVIQPGHVPVVVKNFSSKMEEYEAELHENIMRMDLSWQEKAAAIARLHELEKMKNPKQTPGQTAKLIDKGNSVVETGNAAPYAYEQVKAALFVQQYLDRPEVQKATSLRDATKIASRFAEEEAMQQMRAMAQKKQEEAQKKQVDLAAELNALSLNPGVAPTPPAPAPTNPIDQLFNDLISENSSEFYEGDCLEHLAKLPSKSVSVVITDPPYGVGVAGFNDGGSATTLSHEYSEEGFEKLHEDFIKQLDRICTDNAHVYIFCDPFIEVPGYQYDGEGMEVHEPLPVLWWQRLTECFPAEWRVRRTPLLWTKGHTGNLADGTAQGYKRSYECILYATRGKRPAAKVTSDVMNFPMVRNKIHAAQKPVELYAHLLSMSAIVGDTVLDPFAGCGTIYHAAEGKALKVIGMEQHPRYAEYCRLAMEGKKVMPSEEF